MNLYPEIRWIVPAISAKRTGFLSATRRTEVPNLILLVLAEIAESSDKGSYMPSPDFWRMWSATHTESIPSSSHLVLVLEYPVDCYLHVFPKNGQASVDGVKYSSEWIA